MKFIGVGIVLGAALVFILVVFFEFEPDSIAIGPFSFKPPTKPVETPFMTPTSKPNDHPPASTPGDFEVFDDFNANSFGSTLGKVEGDINATILDSVLNLQVASDGSFKGGGVHIINHDKPLRRISTEVVVREAREISYTYLEVFLGEIDKTPCYANFGVNHDGEFFFASAPVGKSPDGVEKTWPGLGLGYPHDLTVEWQGDQVHFYANQQLVHTVNAQAGGYWAILGAGVDQGGNTDSDFNWIGWVYQ
jgi:hypothetical protein